MGRHKDWWKARLFSYGPQYRGGKVDGFAIAVRADDRTESGRFVSVELADKSVENIRDAMTEYLARDRTLDAEPQEQA